MIDRFISSCLFITQKFDSVFAGPFDVGNFLLGSKNILEMLLVMATSDEPEHQIIAAEAIVHAASKKDKCAAILSEGMGILKKLSKSPNDKVQVNVPQFYETIL